MAPPAGLEPATYGLTVHTGIFNPLLYRLSYRGNSSFTGRIMPIKFRFVKHFFSKNEKNVLFDLFLYILGFYSSR